MKIVGFWSTSPKIDSCGSIFLESWMKRTRKYTVPFIPKDSSQVRKYWKHGYLKAIEVQNPAGAGFVLISHGMTVLNRTHQQSSCKVATVDPELFAAICRQKERERKASMHEDQASSWVKNNHGFWDSWNQPKKNGWFRFGEVSLVRKTEGSFSTCSLMNSIAWWIFLRMTP